MYRLYCSLLIIFLKLKHSLQSHMPFIQSSKFHFFNKFQFCLVDCCTVTFNDTQVITFRPVEGSSSNLEYFVLLTNTVSLILVFSELITYFTISLRFDISLFYLPLSNEFFWNIISIKIRRKFQAKYLLKIYRSPNLFSRCLKFRQAKLGLTFYSLKFVKRLEKKLLICSTS